MFAAADVLIQILCHGANDCTGKLDLPLLRRGQILIGFLRPLTSPCTVQEIAELGVSALAVDLIPRTTRAQSMDVLSAMATVCSYKAVLLAASTLPRMFPMLMTAAGTVMPARVLVIGAGVAGLQAIATARRLGATVWAYDVRLAAKEQILSVGGRVLELSLEVSGAEDERGYARSLDERFYQRQRVRQRQHTVGHRTAARPLFSRYSARRPDSRPRKRSIACDPTQLRGHRRSKARYGTLPERRRDVAGESPLPTVRCPA